MGTTEIHRRCVRVLVFAVVLGGLNLLGGGCATAPRYQPTVTSAAEGAQLRGTREFHGLGHWYRIRLEAVDGKKVNASFWTNWQKPVLVDPGDHVIRVNCVFSMDASGMDSLSVDMNVSLSAGHDY
jgi:hypothetical protein